MRVNTAKEALRREMRARRAAMSEDSRRTEQAALEQALFGTALWRGAQSSLAFISSGTEVSTHEILRQALLRGQRVYAPRVDESGLEICAFGGFDDLVAGPFGILQPQGPSVAVSAFDLVLVPGLAFDRFGGRLGYGGGYYDRLLTELAGPTLGLGFSCQACAKVPEDQWDVRLSGVLLGGQFIKSP